MYVLRLNYSVTFKNRRVWWNFTFAESCQPILDGNKANKLQIISFDMEDTSVFHPVEMINTDDLNREFAFEIVSIIQ